jgi:hypothetical protein
LTRIHSIAIAAISAAALALPFSASAKVTLVKPAPQAKQGELVKLTVKVRPTKTKCAIQVLYSSTASRAKGLGAKRPRRGKVTWTWKVGTNTKPGRWPIKVNCGKAGKLNTRIRVLKG